MSRNWPTSLQTLDILDSEATAGQVHSQNVSFDESGSLHKIKDEKDRSNYYQQQLKNLCSVIVWWCICAFGKDNDTSVLMALILQSTLNVYCF